MLLPLSSTTGDGPFRTIVSNRYHRARGHGSATIDHRVYFSVAIESVLRLFILQRN